GISTAVFWTFAIDFLESTGAYSDWQLPLFWVILGIFGLLGGFSGALIKRFGLSSSYKWGCLIISVASFLLAWLPEQWSMSYLSSALFGISYFFFPGLLLLGELKLFIPMVSLALERPFYFWLSGK